MARLYGEFCKYINFVLTRPYYCYLPFQRCHFEIKKHSTKFDYNLKSFLNELTVNILFLTGCIFLYYYISLVLPCSPVLNPFGLLNFRFVPKSIYCLLIIKEESVEQLDKLEIRRQTCRTKDFSKKRNSGWGRRSYE